MEEFHLINEEKREMEKSTLKPQHYPINSHCEQAPLMGNKVRK